MECLNEGPLAELWEQVVFRNGLTPEVVTHIDVNATIDALKTTKELPLPVVGELLHALSRVLDSSAEFALEDAKETNRELYKTFKDQISLNDGGEIDQGTNSIAPPVETGLELGNLSLPESLIGRKQQTAPEDISIDAIVREDRSLDRSMDDNNNVLEEVPQRSAEELEALEALDLGDNNTDGMNLDAGDMYEFPTIPESDQGLDEGSDMLHSSSPPHTPRADNEMEVRIRSSSSPQQALIEELPRKRNTRRHGAPVDEVISIVRPTKPSPQILRRANTIVKGDNENQQINEESDQFIPLDNTTERLVDPAYVQAEMKRRRLGGDFNSGLEALSNIDDETNTDVSKVGDTTGLDLGTDWDMDMGDLDDEPSRIASDSQSNSSDEEMEFDEQPEDTAETLKEGAAAAKAVLHSHLKKKGSVVEFDDIATSAHTRADTLLEVLALAAKGRVEAYQESAWGPIKITQV